MHRHLGQVFWCLLVLTSISSSSVLLPLVQAQTPTPVIQINLYNDPLDSTVTGGMCQQFGAPPTAQDVVGTTASAFSASLNQTFPATSISDSVKVITNHDVSTDDYRVTVLLPTPAPAHSGPLYACSCPYSSGQDYVCEYAGIGANDTVNIFVTDLNANEAWWQVYGGQIYAKYKIRSKVPFDSCIASGTCIPSMMVGLSGTDSVGFATVGPAGIIESDRSGSDTHIHQTGDRTSADNGNATGMLTPQIDYAYYYQAYRNQLAEFGNLSELQSLIAAQGANSSQMYLYTGASPFILDESVAGTAPITINSGKRVTLFIPADLEFRNTSLSATPQLTSVSNDAFLGIFTSGNVVVTADVGYSTISTDPATATANISAVLVTDGQLTISSDNDPDVTDRKFIGEGTFVAWDKSQVGNGIVLRRNFDNAVDGKTLNSQYSSEIFRFRPAFMANFPEMLKVSDKSWQEIAPHR